jgi:dihydroorotate dehydrogenase electron transfer subunit
MITRCDQVVRLYRTDQLSPSCFRLQLECSVAVAAEPGQFAMLSCTDNLDPLLRRAFSIAGVEPHDDASIVELMIKEVGRGTAVLRKSGPGATMRLLGPLGKGFDLSCPPSGRLALVAGGIGLAPVLFAAERLAARGVIFDLLVGAATAAELLEVDRCAATVKTGNGELVLCTDDGSAGEVGFVTAALARRLEKGRAYVRALGCGPDPMLKALSRLATKWSFAAEVSLEEPMACGVGVCLGCVVELADGRYVPSCQEGPVFSIERLAARWSS